MKPNGDGLSREVKIVASAYAVRRRDQVPEATSVLYTLQRVGGSIGTALLGMRRARRS